MEHWLRREGQGQTISVLTCDLDDGADDSDDGGDDLPLLPIPVWGSQGGDAPVPPGARASSIPRAMGSARECCHPGTLHTGCCRFCRKESLSLSERNKHILKTIVSLVHPPPKILTTDVIYLCTNSNKSPFVGIGPELSRRRMPTPT